MIIHCKNTYGDGKVEYVEYEVDDIKEEKPEDPMKVIIDTLTSTQKSKLEKNENVKKLFDQYEVKT